MHHKFFENICELSLEMCFLLSNTVKNMVKKKMTHGGFLEKSPRKIQTSFGWVGYAEAGRGLKLPKLMRSY